MPGTILVVEDNPDNMKLITWILEDEGHIVVGVPSGEDCLTVLDQNKFDLILMDISLPGIDGKETTRRIRALPNYEKMPIIALTAHAIKGEDVDIWASGVDDLITKPLDEESLLARLRQILT